VKPAEKASGNHAGHSTEVATGVNSALLGSRQFIATTNLSDGESQKRAQALLEVRQRLDLARRQREQGDPVLAEKTFAALLEEDAPEDVKRTALLELALTAQAQSRFNKAQQIFSKFIRLYPGDSNVPEILLRQGLIYRQMGADAMALVKFYAVMTSALNLKLAASSHYQRLVLQAQTEIADTYYLEGKFAESADFFARLLKLEGEDLNKPQIHIKLIRSLANLEDYPDAEMQARDYLTRYAEPADEAEARFLLATALKAVGRKGEAIQQVYLLLQAQQQSARTRPEKWRYWQQRAGNDIANQLYKDGDYVNALSVYLHLAQLDNSPAWQIPVNYQIGLVYERLEQPDKAMGVYDTIGQQGKAAGESSPPTLRAVVEMAKWRKDFLSWHSQVVQAKQEIKQARLETRPAAPEQ
jgi:tetratricopeptide (TPR) repeat protein